MYANGWLARVALLGGVLVGCTRTSKPVATPSMEADESDVRSCCISAPATPEELRSDTDSMDWTSRPVPARDRWQSWNPIPIAAGVSGFWAPAPDDVWAWGGSEVMRWNGNMWTRVDAPVKQTIRAIWGATDDVSLRAWDYTPGFSGGDLIRPGYVDTTLLHWDGRRGWSSVESRRMDSDRHDRTFPDSPPDFAFKLAPPPDAASVVDGDKLSALWTRHADGRAMPALKIGYRTGGDEIWARSADGYQVGHFDGHSWAVAQRLSSGDFSAVWMTGDADGWAVSRSPKYPSDRDPRRGGPPHDGLFRWDGRAWRFCRAVPERTHRLWASGPTDVWAIGERGLVLHWDGARWSQQRLRGDLYAIWGRARDDVWINGCADRFYHWNGHAWSHVPNPVPPGYAGVCLALSGASATDAYAIGFDRFMRWNGAAWTRERGPFDPNVLGRISPRIATLWRAPSSGDLWAVGAEDVGPNFDGWPLVLRRSAGRWSKLATPRTEGHLLGVWGDRDDNVWAVGTKGLILHWDGTDWSQEHSGVVEQLSSIHGAGATLWIVGDRGTVLVRSLGAPGPG